MATGRDIGGSLLKGLSAAGSTFAAGKVRQAGERRAAEAKDVEAKRKVEEKRLEDERANAEIVDGLKRLGLLNAADWAKTSGLTKFPSESVLKRFEQIDVDEQDQFEQALQELLPPGEFGDVDPTGIAGQAGISPGGLETAKGKVDASGLLMDLAPGLPTNAGQPRQNLFNIAVGTDPGFMADLQQKAAKVRFSRETLKAKNKGELAAHKAASERETKQRLGVPVSRETISGEEKETGLQSKYQTYRGKVKNRNRAAKKESKKEWAEYRHQLSMWNSLPKSEQKQGLTAKPQEPEKFVPEKEIPFKVWKADRRASVKETFTLEEALAEKRLRSANK